MTKESFNFMLDEQLKNDAEVLFADLGMDLTTAITCFLKQAIIEQRIPFEITRNIPSRDEADMEQLQKAAK